jgi:hypothetical protein
MLGDTDRPSCFIAIMPYGKINLPPLSGKISKGHVGLLAEPPLITFTGTCSLLKSCALYYAYYSIFLNVLSV